MKIDLHSHTFCSKDCSSSYDRIIDTYRGWLADLPQPVASRIRWENGARMFGLPQVK